MQSSQMTAKKRKQAKAKPKPRVTGRKQLRRYAAEFKADAVKLARRGDRNMREVARGLGIPYQTLYVWVWNAEQEQGRPAPEGESPGEKIKRLERRVAQLEEEREILKKAATFFAKESE
jgi:transposase